MISKESIEEHVNGNIQVSIQEKNEEKITEYSNIVYEYNNIKYEYKNNQYDNNESDNNSIELEKIRKMIELLEVNHHIEIAKILHKNNIKLSENSNGIFINLSNLDNNSMDKIKEYLSFVKNQNLYISKDEETKENLENIYFKDNKDKLTNNNENIDHNDVSV
tara:strand:+ start:2357 stop:2845 length:489 start_codon:yes stop_codon:yes gene_type:complete